jgi:putative membrane protein insertion efficiency factor
MGHRDSSEALGGRGALCASRSRVGAPAPEPGPERSALGELSRVARVLLFAVRVYQTFFSALMPSACKFYPTCSHYAAEAVRLYGARRGSRLALRRLLRCHPFTRGGVDLVPDPAEPQPEESAAAERTVWQRGFALCRAGLQAGISQVLRNALTVPPSPPHEGGAARTARNQSLHTSSEQPEGHL